MVDWTDNYDHGMELDGFWALYYDAPDGWVKVFDLHDDRMPSNLDDDERLVYLVQAWDASQDD